MSTRPIRRPRRRPIVTGRRAIKLTSGGGASSASVQQIVDPGFADNTKWTLAGSGLGTTSVTGGVLNIASTTNVYTAVPTTYVSGASLPGGTYTITYTILNYVSGSVSVSASASSSLSSSVDSTTQSANGTYTQDILLVAPGGFIGIKGQGAAIADVLQIDNFTVVQSS